MGGEGMLGAGDSLHHGTEMLFGHDVGMPSDDALPAVSFLDAHLEDNQGLSFMPPALAMSYGGSEAMGQGVEEENSSLRAISKYLMQERQELLGQLQTVSAKATNMRTLTRLLEHHCRPHRIHGEHIGQGMASEDLHHLDAADQLLVIESHATAGDAIDISRDWLAGDQIVSE